MKRLLTLTSLIILSFGAFAQRWIELGTGGNSLNANSSIYSILTDPAGDVYAAGAFTEETSTNAYVAFWSGSGWTELGTGATALNANGPIYAINRDKFGNIYAAGNFTDSNARTCVMKWNGAKWTEVGKDTSALNTTAPIYALATDAGGNVYAAGAFGDQLFSFINHYYVAVWNGHWSELGFDTLTGLNADSIIYALSFDRQGNLYAAGAFTDSSGYMYVAKWNGSAWTHLGTGSNALKANGVIRTLTTDSLGNVYAAGNFTDSVGNYYIAKWNGTRWTELSSPLNEINITGPIYTLTIDSANNVYAGGLIPDSSGNYMFIAEWDGSRLRVLDNGGHSALHANDAVLTMATDQHGNIYAAGNFTDATPAQYVAEFTTNAALGISPLSSDKFILYPNPTTGIINLKTQQPSGTATIEIFDALGRNIYHQHTDGTTNTRIDMTAFSVGVYTLTLKDDAGGRFVSKVVKQ